MILLLIPIIYFATNVAIHYMFSIGNWCVYKTYGGLYYLYKKIRLNVNANKQFNIDKDEPCIILTQQEYDIFIANNNLNNVTTVAVTDTKTCPLPNINTNIHTIEF